MKSTVLTSQKTVMKNAQHGRHLAWKDEDVWKRRMDIKMKVVKKGQKRRNAKSYGSSSNKIRKKEQQ